MYSIHPMLTQLHLSLSEKDNGSKQFEQFVQTIEKHIAHQTIDFFTAFEPINGYQTIRMEAAQDERVICFLQRATKRTPEEMQPVRLYIEKGGHVVLAHSVINGRFAKKTYQSMHKIDDTFHRIVDMRRLFAETLALNELERFARTNPALLQYLVAHHAAYVVNKAATSLPMDGTFSFDLIKTMKQFGLLRTKTNKTKQVDAYKFIFYATPNEQGYLQGIEHPLMQDIVMPEFLKYLSTKKEETVRKKIEQTTYSKSFQTKKRIRQATQEKMQNNAFLSHYGFVEIDNDVPLAVFTQWEQGFLQLIAQLNIPKASNHSLRFRRLGKQKATGVYYPSFNATVLDLDSPDSYAHELGHQLDYTLAKNTTTCSEELAFRPILDGYKHLIAKEIDALPLEDPFRTQWEGRGKYNRHYYLQSTEIFARSFELYLQAKGMVSPLLQADLTSPVYPKDTSYRERITHYFDALFAKTAENILL